MRALFGSPVGRGTFYLFNLGDLLVGSSSVTMDGTAPDVLRRICLRCVLGLFRRTRRFFGLVLVVTGVVGAPTPSVAAFSPSEVGNVPPFIIVLIFFQIFDGRLFGFVFQSLLLRHFFVVLLV